MLSSVEIILEQSINEIEQFAQGTNFPMLNPPYFSNTFSLWRDIKMKNFKEQINLSLQAGTCTYKDQLRLMALFIDKVDNQLLFQFKGRVKELYMKSFDQNKLNTLNNMNFEVDQKNLSQLLQNELKDISIDLITTLAEWQIEMEVAYDLLRRIHTYELTKIDNQELYSKLPTLNKEVQVDQSMMYEKLMNSLIANVSEFSTQTIKNTCSTGWLKNTAIGSSMIGKLIFQNQGWKFVTNLNFGLLIGGILAETVVKKVGDQIQLQQIRSKLQIQIQHLKLMTSNMREINLTLESLIWKCYSASETIQQFEYNKQKIQLFLQKNFKFTEKDSNLIYCAETDQVILIEEDEDGVIIMTQADVTLNQQIDGDTCVISSHMNEPIKIKDNYF